MNRYSRILDRLKSFRADDQTSDSLKRRILNQLDMTADSRRVKSSLVELLFGWADILWLRRSMVLVSFALIILFLSQQFFIFGRLSSLEDRMTGISTDNILEFQKENMHVNSVVYSMSDEMFSNDSVKVSSRDLSSLIRSYRDLQERYNNLKGSINKDVKETIKESESKLKL